MLICCLLLHTFFHFCRTYSIDSLERTYIINVWFMRYGTLFKFSHSFSGRIFIFIFSLVSTVLSFSITLNFGTKNSCQVLHVSTWTRNCLYLHLGRLVFLYIFFILNSILLSVYIFVVVAIFHITWTWWWWTSHHVICLLTEFSSLLHVYLSTFFY